MTTGEQRPIPDNTVTARLTAAIGQARERREEAAALRAQAARAVRHAGALIEEGNAILQSAVTITEAVLARRRIALAEPVRAAFRADELGSTGIELSVRLADPATVPAARQAIRERFGGEGCVDRLIVR